MLLVIGITGHTGRYFLKELEKNNYNEKIRFLVRKNSNIEILNQCKLNFEIIYGDLNSIEDLKNACNGIDTIFEIYNIKYSVKVLNAAIENDVKRIIFVHTTGIYSKYKSASSEYKEIEEKVIKKAKESKINITILRPTMIYGDLCDHNISKFIKMMDKIKIYPMIAGGKAKIQPVNARDLGKAYYLVLINPERTLNNNYNLSGDAEIAIKDMLKMICRKLGKNNFFVTIPMWMSLMAAYILKFITLGKIDIIEKVLRMDEDRVFSYKNASKDFGYSPSSFEEGIHREVEEYLKLKS